MKSFWKQFTYPTGVFGWLAGHLMAFKNGARSAWALGILQPRDGEKILEVGFGPGVDVRRVAEAVGMNGRTAGVDPSAEMVRQSHARNRAHIREGRVELKRADASVLPFPGAAFDAVYAINSAQFWSNLDVGLREVRRVLRPGGRALIVVQPMWRGATRNDTLKWRDRLHSALHFEGFNSIEIHWQEASPAPIVACLAR